MAKRVIISTILQSYLSKGCLNNRALQRIPQHAKWRIYILHKKAKQLEISDYKAKASSCQLKYLGYNRKQLEGASFPSILYVMI